MATPYSTQTISGYNSSPPSDDGTVSASNEITWSKHKTKLADPIKTLSEAINTELLSAFGLGFGQNITTQATTFNVVAADQGKFFSVTGTSTANLLAAATAGAQFPLLISNDGSGTVTIDPNGAETINGSATMSLVPGECAIITCNGTSWRGAKFLHNASAANVRSALGLVIGTNVQAYDAQLDDVAGLTPTADNFVAGNGSNLVMKTPSQARTSIGLTGSGGVVAIGDLVSASAGTYLERLLNIVYTTGLPTSISKVGEYVAGRTGTYRTLIYVSSRSGNHTLRVYKNGSALGTSRVNPAESTWITEDLSFAAGDLIQIYLQAGSASDPINFYFGTAVGNPLKSEIIYTDYISATNVTFVY